MNKYTVTTGTNLNYDSDATWEPINIRSAAFQWSASGSGTDEYYLEATGGGNPNTVLSGLVQPANVQINGTNATAGTAGSLANLEWAWADNDTLGFSTIYVRLGSGLADPDDQVDGYVTFTDSPNADDDVYFQGSPSINGGDFTNIELDSIIFVPTFAGTVGSADTPLRLDVDNTGRVEVAASGIIHLGLTDAACAPAIAATASASGRAAGFYLHDCSALSALSVIGGTVQLVNSTVADAFISSGATLIGDRDTDCTGDLHNNGGTIIWDGTGVDCYTSGGTSTINGTDAWAVIETSAGTINYNSTGTVTACTAVGTGTVDFTKTSVSQTVTTPKVEGTGKIVYNPSDTTISNVPTGDGPRFIKGGTN